MALEINPDSGTIQNEGGGGITLDPGGTDLVTVSNGMTFPDGTVAEPGIRFADDTNTGMYSPAQETIAFAGEGNDIMRMNGLISAVNYLDLTPSTTGNDVSLVVKGSDANISLALQGKGTGRVKINGVGYPLADGATNNVVMTDGVGNLRLDQIEYSDLASIPGTFTPSAHTHTESEISDLQAYLLNVTAEPLTDLSDVTITTPATDEVLTYNGSAWVNQAVGGGGGADWIAKGGTTGTLPIATGEDSIAIGEDVTTGSGLGNIAIGSNVDLSAVTKTVCIGALTDTEEVLSNYSVILGAEVRADLGGTGYYNVGIGYNSVVGGNSNIQIGKGGSCYNGSEGIAIGSAAINTQTYGVSIGKSTNISGNWGCGIGYQADVNGAHGSALGPNTDAWGDNATAVGHNAVANGSESIAIGFIATADGDNQISIGNQVNYGVSAKANSITIGGAGLDATLADQLRIGTSITEFIEYEASKFKLTGANAQYLLPSYTVATVPTGAVAGSTIYLTDGDAGSACVAVHNGTNWKVVALGATISAT